MTKWNFLLDAPFELSDQCCKIMKKSPAKKYSKQTGRKPFIATMTEESSLRTQKWLDQGCNAYSGSNVASKPMSFWTEQDVLTYIKQNHLPLAEPYGEIVYANTEEQVSMFEENPGKLKTTGCDRTGCLYCGFGCHMEKESRFLRLKETHPAVYDYIMKPVSDGGLGYREVLTWINEHSKLNIRF